MAKSTRALLFSGLGRTCHKPPGCGSKRLCMGAGRSHPDCHRREAGDGGQREATVSVPWGASRTEHLCPSPVGCKCICLRQGAGADGQPRPPPSPEFLCYCLNYAQPSWSCLQPNSCVILLSSSISNSSCWPRVYHGQMPSLPHYYHV